MTNISIRCWTTLEASPAAVLNTDFAEINVSSAVEAQYFVTFIDKTPEHVSACHVKLKDEAAVLLKRNVLWV